MTDKTKDFCRRIGATNEKTTDAEYIALYHELNEYLDTVSEQECNEFAQTGLGETLMMCCPPEAVKLPPEAYLN